MASVVEARFAGEPRRCWADDRSSTGNWKAGTPRSGASVIRGLHLVPSVAGASVSVAAAQARTFYEQVVAEKTVFTVVEQGDMPVFPVGGHEAVPFWSSRSRIARVQELHPKYRRFEILQIDFATFLTETLGDLEEQGVSVGVNWSGERLGGYDLTVAELRRNLEYWRARSAT
jgi:hypothetical protein